MEKDKILQKNRVAYSEKILVGHNTPLKERKLLFLILCMESVSYILKINRKCCKKYFN